MKVKKTRFFIFGLGDDEHNCATDYEKYFGEYDTYEEAYEYFVKLQKQDAGLFCIPSDVCFLRVLIEECEEFADITECIDVRNEFVVKNPVFQSRQ